MSTELNSKMADRIVFSAIAGLWPSRGEMVVCARQALKQAFLAVAQEAFDIGLLAGQETRLRETTLPGSADRPAWMDIRLDDSSALAAYGIRLKPIVIKSLLKAGYQCIGDLRWAPCQQLTALFYVGRKTANQIRSLVERLERDA